MSDVTPANHPILDELYYGKPVRRQIYEFGALIACVMCIIAAYGLLKRGGIADAFAYVFVGLICFWIGARAPMILRPVWRGWMTLGTVLGHIVTPVMLGIGWIILIIPFSILLRVMGKRVMDMSFRTEASTHWMARDTKKDNFKLLERQF